MLEKYRFDQSKASKVHLSALVVILGSVINDKPKWYFRCHWYFRGIACDYPVGVDSNYLTPIRESWKKNPKTGN